MASATWADITFNWADARLTWIGQSASGTHHEGLLVKNKKLWLSDKALPGDTSFGHDDYTLLGPYPRI